MSGVILQKTAAVRNGNVAAVTPVNEAAVGSGDAAAVTLVNTAAVGVRNGFVSENTVPSGPILHNPSGGIQIRDCRQKVTVLALDRAWTGVTTETAIPLWGFRHGKRAFKLYL